MTLEQPRLEDLTRCFEGAVPAVIATASAAGVPNVTYLSRAHYVDPQRIALSNQFFSKSARNLAENPRGCLLLLDPVTHDQYRLSIVFERTERRGPLFDRLRDDVDTIAALTGMQDVFRLRAADVYRVTSVDLVPAGPLGTRAEVGNGPPPPDGAALAELCGRITRAADLDTLVGVTVGGLADLLGLEHSSLLLLDEGGTRLFTIASHGYARAGIGSEVAVGDGVVGTAAQQGATVRVGSLRQMQKYARTVRTSYEESGEIAPGREIPVPVLDLPESRMAVPGLVRGELVLVLAVEHEGIGAFGDEHAAALSVVASLVAASVEAIRAEERAAELVSAAAAPPAPAPPRGTTHVRFFAVDGSVFLDGDYLIRGVAGRILWALLGHHAREGRVDFTNKEVRLDPSLELPDFRDNFESRLILLKRRLDEREAPIRISKTGRGRFRIDVSTGLRLDEVPVPDA